jgi:choline kinase
MTDGKAIILAAGRGSRMGTHTTVQPKCLTSLAGKPLLQWQLDSLRRAGIQTISLLTGYLANTLDPFGLATFHNDRWAQTNMVASLRCAEPWLREATCVVSYADIVYHPRIVTALLQTPGDIVMTYDTEWLALWQLRFEDPLCDAETFRVDDDGQLLAIGQKPTTLDDIQGQYMGLLKITPTGWQHIRHQLDALSPDACDRLDMTSLLGRLLAAGIRVTTCPVTGRWCEVDSPSDLAAYTQRCQSLETSAVPWTHDWRFT